MKFFKISIMTMFGIPQAIIIDNGTQFTDKYLRVLLERLKVKQHFTSVEHSQKKGKAKAANYMLLRWLKRKLQTAKGKWAYEFPHVLWAYQTNPHSKIDETPLQLTYGT